MIISWFIGEFEVEFEVEEKARRKRKNFGATKS
jgi:hypothetical protein